MSDYQGNIIIKNPTAPAGPFENGAAPGVWKLSEVLPFVRQGIWPTQGIQGKDPYFPLNALLLSTTSLSNANNNLFVDSSGAFNPISRNGNTTQGSFTPYGVNWSNYFDGSGDYLTIASNAAFGMGTGDFTIECWINPTAFTGSGNVLVDMRSGTEPSVRPDLEYNSSGTLNYRVNGSTVISGGTLVIGTWSHVVICRSGTTTKMFLNGTQVGSSYTDSNNYGSSAACRIGADDDGSPNAYVNGYMSNVRVVKGTAVYTSNFTVPTANLTAISGTSLLTCQSNRFLDASTNNFAVTANGNTAVTEFSPFSPAYPGMTGYNQSDIQYWSGYFDGSGDYLYYGANSAFAFGTGNFTVEFFVYTTSTASQMIYDTIQPGISGGGSNRFYVHTNTSQQIVVGPATSTLTTTGTITLGAWNHIAVVRNGSTRTVYINGVSAGSDTFSGDLSSGYASVGFDRASGGSIILNGYLSNLRAVKGTAVYTSTFTPPTAPLTAISGTSLLVCQSAAFTDNSTNNFVVTINGNTTVTGNNPFQAGLYSNYFDGSGDYFTVPYTTANFDWWTSGSDFTIEYWFFANSLTGISYNDAGILHSTAVGNRSATAATDYWSFGPTSAGTVTFYYYNGGGNAVTSSATFTNNSWNHVAMTKTSSGITVFVNGVAGTTTAISGTPQSSTGVPLTVGQGNNSSFNGYISNLRIVRGTAIYSGNFTVPTSSLTAVTNTKLLTCQSARFIDNSTNALTLTITGNTSVQPFDPFYTSTIASNGGSMYFDGTGDYLRGANGPAFQFGTGDFTVEMWAYFMDPSATNRPLFDNGATSNTGRLLIRQGNDAGTANVVNAFVSGTTASSPTIQFYSWTHVAVVRQSGTVKIYINGVGGTGVTATADLSQNACLLGAFYDVLAANFTGYMSNVRVTKGTAIYTANFTPPTAPVTPSANTSLLVNGMNAGAYDATAINDMETVGDAQVSTVQSKFGGSSMYFDGSGDNLFMPSATNMNFGTGNWTIECWVYVSTRTTNYPLIFGNNRGSFTTDALALTNSNADSVSYNDKFVIAWGSGGWSSPSAGNSQLLVANVTNSTGTWYHLAIVRDSSTSVKMFRNGTQVANATVSSGATFNWGYSGAFVGGGNWDGAQGYFNGYIDDLRITRGVARYTTTFTPPTQAFPIY